METWDAIRSRRNTREYQDRPIDRGDLDRILEAGRRSPSSMNEQPWDFIAVTDRATLERMADLWRWGAHIRGAAAVLHGKITQRWGAFAPDPAIWSYLDGLD